jgi:hypothetical protein
MSHAWWRGLDRGDDEPVRGPVPGWVSERGIYGDAVSTDGASKPSDAAVAFSPRKRRDVVGGDYGLGHCVAQCLTLRSATVQSKSAALCNFSSVRSGGRIAFSAGMGLMRPLKPNARQFVALLARSGMSQADAARSMHYSTATISRWCSGEVDCPDSALDHMVRITGIRPDGPHENLLREGPVWLDDWQVELLGLFGGLTQERRSKAIAAVRQLIAALVPGTRYKVPKSADHGPTSKAIVQTFAGDIISHPTGGELSSADGEQPASASPRAKAQHPDAP